MNEVNPILEIKGLYKKYKRNGNFKQAVSDMNLFLMPGEIVGVIGESGSGKSTLLRCVACLDKPSAGEIKLCGVDIFGKRPGEVCKSVQMVFQDAMGSFDPRMRVGTSLTEPLKRLVGLSGQDLLDRKDELIHMVGLDPQLADRYPSRLSGGQCQRFAIARGLAGEPKILLCDEVTSALDVSAQAQIVDLLSNLRHELGLSILFVSHDLALASGLCDRLIVMRDGKMVEEGPTELIIHQPKDSYTKLLLSSALFFEN